MYRSLLFTSGHKIEHVRKLKNFTDILVIDMDDTLPSNKKNINLQKT